MKKIIDLTGIRFGRLTPIKFIGINKHNKSIWLCLCDCGKEKSIVSNNFKNGHTKSCGCLNIEKIKLRFTTHGHSQNKEKSKIYRTWNNVVQRCYNIKSRYYEDYGGRGITVCDRWLPENNGFINFLEDMGEPPTSKHQIDRIDNDKLINGYCKENCRWVTSKEQARNTRHNHLLKYDNKELCFAEWEEITGIPQSVIARRTKDKWPPEETLTTPAKINANKSLAFPIKKNNLLWKYLDV